MQRLISSHLIVFRSSLVLTGTNRMPLKVLNKNDPIRKCFEAYANFKGI